MYSYIPNLSGDKVQGGLEVGLVSQHLILLLPSGSPFPSTSSKLPSFLSCCLPSPPLPLLFSSPLFSSLLPVFSLGIDSLSNLGVEDMFQLITWFLKMSCSKSFRVQNFKLTSPGCFSTLLFCKNSSLTHKQKAQLLSEGSQGNETDQSTL